MSLSLENRQVALTDKLTASLDDVYGPGFMSTSIYDTAWVSLITKTLREGTKYWLFPQCFQYLLKHQRADGSWESYASQIDGVLNTSASLLSLYRHLKEPLQDDSIGLEELQERVQRASTALQRLLDDWDVAKTIHVGFEILVPALLSYLKEEGFTYSFPQQDVLCCLNQKKLSKFHPSYLYASIQTTALHSLEAFIGKVDFTRVAHHKHLGSFMASPSSTAAYLMNIPGWDDECEEYLRHTFAYGAGRRDGSFPSAFPSPIFELTWTFSTLLHADAQLPVASNYHLDKTVRYLQQALDDGEGAVGFAPGMQPDADDTAKSILVLNLANHSTSADSLLKNFETETHFRTYAQERDPSFSANCNVLTALLHLPNPSKYRQQIEKCSQFLCKHYLDSDSDVRDKWNISPYYPLMLMSQAFSSLGQLWTDGTLSELSNNLMVDHVPQVLDRLSMYTLETQNEDGTWGASHSHEETSYALVVLVLALSIESLKSRHDDVRRAIRLGRTVLQSTNQPKPARIWVEKVTYSSHTLTESYVLAALRYMERAKDLIEGVVVELKSSNGTTMHSVVDSRMENKMRRPMAAPQLSNGMRGAGTLTPPLDEDSCSDIDYVYEPTVRAIAQLSPKQAAENAASAVSYPFSAPWTKQSEDIITSPYTYLDNQPGKDIRSIFLSALNAWLLVPTANLKLVAGIIRMLHNSSLLIDDIEDNSDLRRGMPVAHAIHGIPQTINSGNYVYFLALRELRKLSNPDAAIEVFSEELINLHRGQGLDLYWRDSLTCPSEQEYLAMVSNKTGGLFRLAARLLQTQSQYFDPTTRTCSRDTAPLVTLLGLIFQICDDYLNLKSTKYAAQKGNCEDLTEGKFSFPIIHSIHTAKRKNDDVTYRQLMNILRLKPTNDALKKVAVRCMEDMESFEYTRHFVGKLTEKALAEIGGHESGGWGENQLLRDLMGKIAAI